MAVRLLSPVCLVRHAKRIGALTEPRRLCGLRAQIIHSGVPLRGVRLARLLSVPVPLGEGRRMCGGRLAPGASSLAGRLRPRR